MSVRHFAAGPRPSRRLATALRRLVSGFHFIIILGLAAPLAAQSVKPVDEAPRDRALVAVRAAVLAAARKRDINALLRHVDRAAAIGNANAEGHAAWRKWLQRNPDFWDELVWELEHGGKFGGRYGGGDRIFTAPYMAKLDMPTPTDSHVVVVGANVPAYAAPRRDSPVLATYSHELLDLVKWDKARLKTPFYRSSGWVETRTKENRPAFLEARFVRAINDYRLGFQKAGDTWQIIYFVAGD